MGDPVELVAVLSEIIDERRRQDEKWGEQNHPSIVPDVGGARSAALYYAIASADGARRRCQSRAARNAVTWPDILIEELAEAVDAAAASGESPELRAELIQCAAVLVAWVECIDRRSNKDNGDA